MSRSPRPEGEGLHCLFRTLAVVFLLSALPGDLPADGFKGFSLQATTPEAVTRVRFPDGSTADRFILKPGDCPTRNDCANARERAERFERGPGSATGQVHWYAWSIFLPRDFPDHGKVPVTLGQFHPGRPGERPPVKFQLRGAQYQFRQTDSRTRADDLEKIDLISLARMRGRWTRIEVEARWSAGPDGFIRVWVNGRKRVDLSGANLASASGPVFRYGIYRSFTDRAGRGGLKEVTVYWRDVARAANRAGLGQ